MNKYHEIQTVYKRDPKINYLTLLIGEYSEPEFEWLANNEWVWTEKVNGTNIRIMWDGESLELKFGGKTDNAQIPTPLINSLTKLFSKEKFMGYESMCLYGEGYGAKIQKGGGNYRPDQNFVLFDVKIGDWWLQRKDVKDIGEKFCLAVVPIIEIGTLDNMVALAQMGYTSIWGDFQAEGIVARPETELKTRSGHRIITKIKHKDFK